MRELKRDVRKSSPMCTALKHPDCQIDNKVCFYIVDQNVINECEYLLDNGEEIQCTYGEEDV